MIHCVEIYSLRKMLVIGDVLISKKGGVSADNEYKLHDCTKLGADNAHRAITTDEIQIDKPWIAFVDSARTGFSLQIL